jgi:taurine dioxygenase
MNQQSGTVAGTRDVTTRPLSAALGVEVQGADLRELHPGQKEQILDAWHENLVVLIRGQALSEEDQVAFGKLFGGGSLSAGHIPMHEKVEGVAYVTNVQQPGAPVGILPDGEMQFHSDQCYRERPSKGTMLYAIEIPSEGGNTLFANTYKAYETLPEEVKQRLTGLRALNVYDYGLNPTQRGVPNKDAPSWVHPVVRTHPVTRRKSLYVNRLMTAYIEGLPQEESDELLSYLFDHQEQQHFVYSHRWRVGDVLIWDNRCALHARTDFDSTQRRVMRRITLPAEPVE